MGFIDRTKIQTEVNVQLLRNEKVVDKRIVSNVITNNGLYMIADRTIGRATNIVNKIAIGNNDTGATKSDTALRGKLVDLVANISILNNVITYDITFTQLVPYEVKEAGLLSSNNILYARTVFPVINKGVNDTLKITWKWTIQ